MQNANQTTKDVQSKKKAYKNESRIKKQTKAIVRISLFKTKPTGIDRSERESGLVRVAAEAESVMIKERKKAMSFARVRF